MSVASQENTAEPFSAHLIGLSKTKVIVPHYCQMLLRGPATSVSFQYYAVRAQSS